jgi:hypothetical protein
MRAVLRKQSSMPKKTQRRKNRRARALQTRLGAPLETLITDPDAPPSLLQVLAYGPEVFTEQALENPEQARSFFNEWPVTWVNVESLGDVAVIKKLGDIFGLH